MKKFIAAAVAVAALLMGTAPAFAGPELGVDAFSRHVWRGTAGTSSISIQPSLDLVTADTNIGSTSVNIWGQIPLTDAGGDTEYDFTIAQEVLELGTVNLTSYYYGGPFLESDSHDIELSVAGSVADVGVFVGRFVSGDAVKDDTYIELNYALDGYNLHVGAGDGAYVAEGDGFALVNVGVSVATEDGYGASFIYNPDSETPYFVVSKSW